VTDLLDPTQIPESPADATPEGVSDRNIWAMIAFCLLIWAAVAFEVLHTVL
jgi:hypothetical protein